jgi:hypothetical protein
LRRDKGGGLTAAEAVAHGIQSGLYFLSLMVAGVGLLVTALLVQASAAN